MIGIPVIANAVGHEVAYYPEILFGLPWNPVVRPLVKLSLKSSNEIIAISREALRWAYRWSRRKGFIIYEGIDIENYDCNNITREFSEEPILVTISFLFLNNVIRKDIPTLIKAIKEVKEYFPNVKLYVISKKMDKHLLLLFKEMVQKLGIVDNVIFTGELSHVDLLKLLCRADLFVMTSYQEGFPTAACEASVVGVPVIVSDRPAMNEVFTDDIAVIVRPGNPSELANAIVGVLENRGEALERARRAQIIIKHNYSLHVRESRMRKFMQLFIKRLIKGFKYNLYRYSLKYIALFLLVVIVWWPLYILSNIVFTSAIRFKEKQLLEKYF
jgi:glycosyltransferase involved in cell wall biosynthesis